MVLENFLRTSFKVSAQNNIRLPVEKYLVFIRKYKKVSTIDEKRH